MNKILLIPPMQKWYMEAHAEYLIRHLSDEFFIEVADVPYPPYENFLGRPETNPFQRSPDDYDLLVPLLPTHWVITDKDKYAHKVATIFYQDDQTRMGEAAVGATTPFVEAWLRGKKVNYHSLRFGIDTDLFKPLNMAREDDLFHVGVVGSVQNPRRMMRDVILPLAKVKGIRLMIFPVNWDNNGGEIGKEILPYVVSGNKYWVGLPNIYNRLDLLLRIESDPGYSFPVLEASACGIPFVATDCGIDKELSRAGAGVLISGNRQYYLEHPDKVAERVREVVIQLRDNRQEAKKMGLRGREEVELRWKWEHHLLAWREFFREGLKHVLQKRI